MFKYTKTLSSDGEWSIFDDYNDMSKPLNKSFDRLSVYSERSDVSDKLSVSSNISLHEMCKKPIKYTENILCRPLKPVIKEPCDIIPIHRRFESNSFESKVQKGEKYKKTAIIKDCQNTSNRLVAGSNAPQEKSHVRPCILPKVIPAKLNKDSISTPVVKKTKVRIVEPKLQKGVNDKIIENIKNCQKIPNRLVAGSNAPCEKSHVRPCILPKVIPAKLNKDSISTPLVKKTTIRIVEPKLQKGVNDKIIENIKNCSLKAHNGNKKKFHPCHYAYGDTNHVSLSDGDAKNRCMTCIGDTHYCNSYKVERQRLKKLTRKSRILQKKEIKHLYTERTYKVKKLAPFVRKSSSFINRQVKERETDRINFILCQKLLRVKACVSTYH
ncbi:unnamed protein product [Aphis gossypii]|uniref:Uncharacterized protein n=1 Tax=Aphis gossypii TaxID=80765 RepID=A0A9P0IMM2_APHGO|nr:unnamed protein product [Aphis gossypii]